MLAVNMYAQTKTEVIVGNKTFIKSEHSYGEWRLANKASNAIYESQYEEKAKSNDPEKRYDATNQLKFQGNNADILAAIQSVFTPTELLDLKDEKINLLLRINNEGKIVLVYFSFKNSKVKNLSLSKFSLLEDRIISSMTFKIPDKSIYVYTIFIPLQFSKLYNNTPLFGDKAFD